MDRQALKTMSLLMAICLWAPLIGQQVSGSEWAGLKGSQLVVQQADELPFYDSGTSGNFHHTLGTVSATSASTSNSNNNPNWPSNNHERARQWSARGTQWRQVGGAARSSWPTWLAGQSQSRSMGGTQHGQPSWLQGSSASAATSWPQASARTWSPATPGGNQAFWQPVSARSWPSSSLLANQWPSGRSMSPPAAPLATNINNWPTSGQQFATPTLGAQSNTQTTLATTQVPLLLPSATTSQWPTGSMAAATGPMSLAPATQAQAQQSSGQMDSGWAEASGSSTSSSSVGSTVWAGSASSSVVEGELATPRVA